MNHLIKSNKFSESLVTRNGLDRLGFSEWAFLPGMLYHASEKWWGERGERAYPHEGIDLCFYKTAEGQVLRLDDTIEIPVIFRGVVVKVDDDFLGKSIYVRHDDFEMNGRNLYTIYGHTVPCEDVDHGRSIEEGELIAAISSPSIEEENLFPHLHLSMAWIPTSISLDELNWRTIGTNPLVTLLDPLEAMSVSYTTLTYDFFLTGSAEG